MSLDAKLPEALAFASATELVRRLKAREFTARALLEFQLERVARLDPEINAIVYTTFRPRGTKPTEPTRLWPAARIGGRCTGCR